MVSASGFCFIFLYVLYNPDVFLAKTTTEKSSALVIFLPSYPFPVQTTLSTAYLSRHLRRELICSKIYIFSSFFQLTGNVRSDNRFVNTFAVIVIPVRKKSISSLCIFRFLLEVVFHIGFYGIQKLLFCPCQIPENIFSVIYITSVGLLVSFQIKRIKNYRFPLIINFPGNRRIICDQHMTAHQKLV